MLRDNHTAEDAVASVDKGIRHAENESLASSKLTT